MRLSIAAFVLAVAPAALVAQSRGVVTSTPPAGKVTTSTQQQNPPAKQGVKKQQQQQQQQQQQGGPKTGKPTDKKSTPADKTKKPKDGEEQKPAEKPVEEVKIPASADPADIRAIQSANAMIEAERRLKKLLRAGKIKGIDQILTFEEISSWPYEDGLKGMPGHVKKLAGRKVMMTGFMLPIDEVENIKEFLLVQSLWACCYGQPPDINGIVRVVMTGKNRCDYQFEPIKIVGEFKVEPCIEDGYCVDIFQLHTDKIEVIQ